MKKISIEIEQLCHAYKNKQNRAILNNISVKFYAGEFVTIIGPSGCGKSTLLKIMSGLEKNYQGKVLLGDNSPPVNLKRHNISLIFQHPTLLPWLNVIKNIELPKSINGNTSGNTKRILELTGVESYSDLLPQQLSGGMKQRVSLARSLYSKPKTLLMDEPFSSLDEYNRFHICKMVYSVWKKTKTLKNIILVTHSIDEAVLVSDRILILSGSPANIVKDIKINLKRNDLSKTIISDKYNKYVKDIRKILYENSN